MPLNKAKIIATLGPATTSDDVLGALLAAGANVVRLNFSHGDRAQHAANVARVRALSAQNHRPVAILADLQGPKIRTAGVLDDQPVMLVAGDTVRLTCGEPLSRPGVVATPFQPLIDALRPEDAVLINDGRLRLRVLEREDAQTLRCRVELGGPLTARKGLNVPTTPLPISALTEKDLQDLDTCMDLGVDYVALSFVQTAADVQRLRQEVIDRVGRLPAGHIPPALIAKIEKPQAVEEMSHILEVADGIMVARGDLGVELSLAEVPWIQKQLVAEANRAGKPVIIATQMLESMILAPEPTRAEVSDVANGVFDGADALMLSGETAAGDFPVDAVRTMRQVIEEAEAHTVEMTQTSCMMERTAHLTLPDAIAHATCATAELSDARAIVVFSTSGRMALRISKRKPQREIIALTPDPAVFQRLSLLWGVTPMCVPFEENADRTLALAEDELLARGLLADGDVVVLCAGQTPLHGVTHMLKITTFGQPIREGSVPGREE